MSTPEGTLFFLPGLGFGARAAEPLAIALGDRFRVVGIDLPGQGGAPDAADGSARAMTDAALALIEAEADGGPWMLVAHSMGGKIAALLLERVLSGRANVFGLAGAVLLAPSPPTPEPMDDDKRAQMLGWAEGGAISEAHAREFVAQNVATPLQSAAEQDAVSQVRQTSPLAWRRWLTEGSREDVSETVGVLDLPVTVIAGENDDDLGSDAQPGLLGSVYPRARFVSLAETGHLLAAERATEVADRIARLWETTVAASPRVPAEWGRVIASDRTPVETRALLARRALADDPDYAPRALSRHQLETLRGLAARLVPQTEGRGGPGDQEVDLAARVDADLAAGRGDGWRPAELPDDASAYRLGLDAIARVWPASPAEQDALVDRIVAGESIAGDPWGEGLLGQWFDDLRTDLVRTWLAHPASLARVGYDGFATSGTGEGPAGFRHLGAGIRDPWEPGELGVLATGATGTTREDTTAPDTTTPGTTAPDSTEETAA